MPRFSETTDFKLLRQISVQADLMASAAIGTTMSPCTAVLFMLNSLTGLSLLTLPYGFTQAGIILGPALLLVCMALSFITATFMCEALTIANALTYEDAERRVVDTKPDVRQHLHEEFRSRKATPPAAAEAEWPAQSPVSLRTLSASTGPGPPEDEEDSLTTPLTIRRENTMEAFVKDMRESNVESEFKIRERVELGQMGEAVLHTNRSKWLARLIYFMIVSFTYGTAAALTVTVNESLSHTFCSFQSLGSPGSKCDEDTVYTYCVMVSFCITLPLCFANLQKTKSFTLVIMACRFIAIALMLIIAGFKSYERLRDEGRTAVVAGLPVWEFDNFMAVFGNAVFLFGIHHYLPSMISPLQPQRLAPRVIATAFCSCYVLIVAVCATGLIAWGGQAEPKCSDRPGGHFCTVQPLYNLNFAPLGWLHGGVAIFITAYPAMAIASIPIAVITTKNTMARWLGISLPEEPYSLKNLLITLAVLVPPNVVALITKDVQKVIAFVGGYAGLTVTVICPLVLLFRLRRMLALDVGPISTMTRPLRSPFGHCFGYSVVAVFYVISLIFVTKKLFHL